MQICIGSKLKSLLSFTFRIQFNQFTRNVFHLRFGTLLQAFPSAASQFIYFGRFVFLAFVFRYSVQSVYTNENNIIVFIEQFYHFLHFSVDIGTHQSTKNSHTMINMHQIIAQLKLIQLFERHHYFSLTCFIGFELIFVKTVENLMIGVTQHRQIVIDKTFVQSIFNRLKMNIITPIIKNRSDSISLLHTIT